MDPADGSELVVREEVADGIERYFTGTTADFATAADASRWRAVRP